jgi:glycosyltransferase involved in cell wall biosynthesis
MAAGTAVVGTAVHSIAELVAHKVNGLLFKQVPGRSMSAAILARLQDRASQEKAKEVARGQAYEAFGLRRYIEQTTRLYENVLSGSPPREGITDSALDS